MKLPFEGKILRAVLVGVLLALPIVSLIVVRSSFTKNTVRSFSLLKETITPNIAEAMIARPCTIDIDTGSCDSGSLCTGVTDQCTSNAQCGVGEQCLLRGGDCGENICACIPQCSGKNCGGDGCGGTCGPKAGLCDNGYSCSASGVCAPMSPYCPRTDNPVTDGVINLKAAADASGNNTLTITTGSSYCPIGSVSPIPCSTYNTNQSGCANLGCSYIPAIAPHCQPKADQVDCSAFDFTQCKNTTLTLGQCAWLKDGTGTPYTPTAAAVGLAAAPGGGGYTYSCQTKTTFCKSTDPVVCASDQGCEWGGSVPSSCNGTPPFKTSSVVTIGTFSSKVYEKRIFQVPVWDYESCSFWRCTTKTSYNAHYISDSCVVGSRCNWADGCVIRQCVLSTSAQVTVSYGSSPKGWTLSTGSLGGTFDPALLNACWSKDQAGQFIPVPGCCVPGVSCFEDGKCDTTSSYSCLSSASAVRQPDSAGYYVWDCPGTGGGTTANCTFAKPVPAAPVIGGQTAPYVNQSYPYTFRGSDPLGQNVSYRVDWDNNGTVDQSTVSGASGWTATLNHTWTSAGAKTFKALTAASDGRVSPWAPFNLTVPNPIPGTCLSTHYNCAPNNVMTNSRLGSDRWYWDCEGTLGGGAQRGCFEMYPLDGACSAAHYGCNTPTASPLASQKDNLTNWTWTCPGQYGGKDTSCVQNKIPVNGQCGVSPTKPNHYVCNSGTVANTSYNAFTYTYNWDCLGANGGTTPPTCTETVVPPPVDGACKLNPITNYPQHYDCQFGNSVGGHDAGASWQWTCAGLFTGKDKACEEFKPVNAVCAATHYSCQPGTGTLKTGSSVDGATTWTWTCDGLYGGAPANCKEYKAPTITWNPSAGPTIAYNTSVSYSFSTTNAANCDYYEVDASNNIINPIPLYGATSSKWSNPAGPYTRDVYRRLTCYGSDGKSATSNYHITVLQNDSACISITPPSYLLPGQTFNATAKMWNRGANPWTTGTMNYVLARYDKLWKGNTMSLTNAPVAKDTQGNFTGSFQATTTEGVYDFSFRMQPIFNGTDWSLPAFGPTCAAQTSSGGAIVVKKATLGLTPQTYQFADTVIGDTPSTTTVHFRNLGGGTINGIKIGNISSPFACIPAGCNLTLGPGASGDIVLSFAPASTTREDRYAPITNTNTNPTVPIVDSNPPYGAVSQIYIYGKGTEKYMVSFDTAGAHPTGNADFFEVPWTTPKFMNLTITNRSKEKGGLVKPNVDASAVFSCTKNCGTTTLRPGESTTVQVKFMPNTKVDKVYTGVFNVGATPDVHVGLSGHGVQPEYRTSEK